MLWLRGRLWVQIALSTMFWAGFGLIFALAGNANVWSALVLWSIVGLMSGLAEALHVGQPRVLMTLGLLVVGAVIAVGAWAAFGTQWIIVGPILFQCLRLLVAIRSASEHSKGSPSAGIRADGVVL